MTVQYATVKLASGVRPVMIAGPVTLEEAIRMANTLQQETDAQWGVVQYKIIYEAGERNEYNG